MLEQNIRLVRGSPFGSDVSCVNIWLQEEEEEEQEEERERLPAGAELPPNSPHAVATSTQNSLDIVHKFASQLAKIYEKIQT